MAPAGDFSTLTQNASTGVYTRTMPNGTRIYFNSTGKQTSWADRNNNTFTDSYDGSGRLSTITDTYNLVTTLTYNAQGYVSSITEPAQRITSLSYDASNRLISVRDVDGSLTSYSYDAPAAGLPPSPFPEGTPSPSAIALPAGSPAQLDPIAPVRICR